jgi:myo-inositol 2-dehydrogenase/D-chiro-inositol 1-dehydrogenase
VIVALFGAGRIGALHGARLAGENAVKRLLIADIDTARATELAVRLGAEPMSVDAAFAAGPDAAVVAVPTDVHAPLVRRCLDRGVPVFCEKPLAMTVEETVALVDASERPGAAVLQVGFMRRFDPAIVELARRWRDGELGRVYIVRIASHDHRPLGEHYLAHSGGIFRDWLIHDFDMVRFVSGSEVAWVYAVGAVRTLDVALGDGDVDVCALTLGLDGGELVSITGSREDGRGEDVRIEVIGSADALSAGFNAKTPLGLLDPIGVAPEEPFAGASERFAEAYAAEIGRFLDIAARADSVNHSTAREALSSLLVAVAAERSLAEGRPVAVERAGELLNGGRVSA